MQAAPRPEQSFKDLFDMLAAQIERVFRGKRRAVHLSLVCLFSEGHLLIEDVPGVGKTSLAEGDRARDRRFVAPRAVHARPAPVRHHRRLRLGPRTWRLRVPAGRRLRERRAGRRDQPRVAQDAVGTARVDGGASGQRRRADLQAAAPVHGDRDPEPGRARRHVSPARGAARPVPVAAAHRVSRPRRGDRHPRRRRRRPDRPRRARAGHRPRDRRRVDRRSWGASTSRPSCRDTSSTSPRPRATTATSCSA